MPNNRFLLLLFLLVSTTLSNSQNLSAQTLIVGKVISEDDRFV